MLLEKAPFLWRKTNFSPKEDVIFPQLIAREGSSIFAREGSNFPFIFFDNQADVTGELP